MNTSTFPIFRSACAGVILAAGIWAPLVHADLSPVAPTDAGAGSASTSGAPAAVQAAPMAAVPAASIQPPPLQAQAAPRSAANMLSEEMIGGIDWQNNVVYGVGDGVPPADAISPAQARVRAKRAAIDEAMARLLETVKEVRVDAESTTRNYISENRLVGNRVSGIVRNAEVVEIRQANDGSFQVKMAMPLAGPHGLSAILLPAQIHKQTLVAKQAPGIDKVGVGSVSRRPLAGDASPAAAGSEASPNVMPAITPAAKPDESAESIDSVETPPAGDARTAEVAYTSVVIDARGLPTVQAMFPRILTRSGEVLYDVTIADPNATVAHGLAAYGKSLDELGRAGEHPLVIKAVDVAGSAKADLVVADADGGQLAKANSGAGLLQQAQVFVLTD